MRMKIDYGVLFIAVFKFSTSQWIVFWRSCYHPTMIKKQKKHGHINFMYFFRSDGKIQFYIIVLTDLFWLFYFYLSEQYLTDYTKIECLTNGLYLRFCT